MDRRRKVEAWFDFLRHQQPGLALWMALPDVLFDEWYPSDARAVVGARAAEAGACPSNWLMDLQSREEGELRW